MNSVGIQHSPITIIADDGIGHEYVIIPFGAGEGWPLGMRIAELISPPLGVVIDGLVGGLDDVPDAINKLQAGVTQVADGGIGAMGSSIGSLAGVLAGDMALVRQLVKHVTRDGQKLSNPAVFDMAYQANYGELLMALYHVLRVNWGPLFARRFGGYLAKIQARFGAVAQPTETPPG